MMKRNALSDLTNSNHLPSSSISSSPSIPPNPKPTSNQIKKIHQSNNIPQISLNPLDVKPLTVRCRKNEKKELAIPNPLTVRCRKKQRVVSSEQRELEDFIEKQKAYYKEIDEFELEEEEVQYIDQ